MSRYPAIHDLGRCPVCGKVAYATRGDARKARRTVHANTTGMQVYLCSGYYHIGRPAPQEPQGAQGCPTPDRPHHPDRNAAQAAQETRARRTRNTAAGYLYLCRCGGGWCLGRNRDRSRTPRTAQRQQGAA